MRLPLTLALLLTADPVASQGLESAVDAADRMNEELSRRNALTLDRGKVCAAMVRSGQLAPGAMAQYRCILSGASVGTAAAAAPAGDSAHSHPVTPTATLGPKAPRP